MSRTNNARQNGLLGSTLVGLLAAAGTSAAASPADPWMPVRTHNPFLQIFGLPAFEGAALAPGGETDIQLAFDLANHAESAISGAESIEIDGESYYLTLEIRRRVFDRLELSVDLPLVAHVDGVLDNAIEGWHDLWGMTNAKREGPSNQLLFRYTNPSLGDFQLDSRRSGLGDVRVGAAVPLASGKRNVSLRFTLKLPTGDAGDLLGSGGTDYAAGIYADESALFGYERLDVSAHAGVLVTGDSDLFSAIQEEAVPFGGVSASWRINEHWQATGVLYGQGAYFDSGLEEIGGSTVQLALGGNYRSSSDGPVVSFGFVEELFSDATVDFALMMSVNYALGGAGR